MGQSTGALDGRSTGAFQRFFHSEAAGSVLLLLFTAIALAWANSPWSGLYDRMLHAPIGVSVGGWSFSMSAAHWVNDGLMAVFFFVVGLEIKREILVGQLSTFRSALLPVAAALGGLVAPALIYASLNAGTPGARGWGVPMATDIAFALGVLALVGPRVPVGLKVFLTALAIADDLGAVLVIAVFYTERVSLAALATEAALVAALFLAIRMTSRWYVVYTLLAVAIWAAMLASGVHATVAGILVAMAIPVRARIEPERFIETVRSRMAYLERGGLTRDSMVRDREQMAAIENVASATLDFLPAGFALERYLHPVTAFGILPVFALFNAGVRLDGRIQEAVLHPVSLGIVLGLFFGKQVGITLTSLVAVKTGQAELPPGVTLAQIYGASILGGIGFTMSIFVASLAFAEGPLLAAAKLGILAASAISGVTGFVVLKLILRRAPAA
ncbi:MAG TPA: Na+/H+ antiporter NhaA [Anaeromyxobacteraceae bacterium]|nr:Na+/H+ antiporter NhaA [Anaeromyxobacteraceae bacterium]